MGWAIAGGVLGIILMFGAYRWAVGFATARSGGVYIPTIGTRPRRLAGVPEEAPADAKMPPGMVVLRHAGSAIVIEPVSEEAKIGETSVAAGSQAADEAEVVHPDDTTAELATSAEPEVVAVAPVSEGSGSGIEVAAINHGSDDAGEFVLISNGGPNPVALEGWKLTDEGEKHAYEFPAIILESQAELRVHMWRGEDTATDLYVGRRSRWWNNDGDTAYLYDAAGTLVHTLSDNNEA